MTVTEERGLQGRHTVLCINVGSSSCKFALYSVSGGAESLIAEGAADRIGSSGGKIRIHHAHRRLLPQSDRMLARPPVALDPVFDEFDRLQRQRLHPLGH